MFFFLPHPIRCACVCPSPAQRESLFWNLNTRRLQAIVNGPHSVTATAQIIQTISHNIDMLNTKLSLDHQKTLREISFSIDFRHFKYPFTFTNEIIAIWIEKWQKLNWISNI